MQSEICNRGFGLSGNLLAGFWFVGDFVIGILTYRGFVIGLMVIGLLAIGLMSYIPDCWEPLGLLGPPLIAGGPCALHNMHNPLLYATVAMGCAYCAIKIMEGVHGYWWNGLYSYNRHWTEHLNSQNCKWSIFSFWISWLSKKVLASKMRPRSPALGNR